jgi:hypothetical protein
LKTILRILVEIYSFLFHGLLSLFLLGIALVVYISGSTTFAIDFLPWEGPPLVRILLLANLIGLAVIVLAAVGKFRLLYPLWAVVVLYYAANGVFVLKTYSGPDEFQWALLFLLGAFLALLGSLSQARRSFQRKSR